MKNFLKKTTIFLLFVSFGFFFTNVLFANDNPCPANMSLDQCYNHLTKKMTDLQKQAKETTENLSTERYNQLTLNQRIEYTKRKIQESEIEIQRIELEIEAQNVEIRMLERDIEETQNNIATVEQEKQKLDASISKRLTLSYKYSFVNALELLVQSQDLDFLLRKMKYLVETKRSDRELLAEMNNKSVILDAEEKVLGVSKLNLEKARIEVEEKKTSLNTEKDSLAKQQQEQAYLLDQSKKREESYKDALTQIEASQNQVTQQITAVIRQMYERGQIVVDREVSKGEIIGFQGYTGFTYGSHLHLEVYNARGQRVNPFSAGYFTGGSLYTSVGSGTYNQPLDGGVLTQTFHSVHPAIDLQSTSSGDQSGDQYYGHEIRCYGMTRRTGYYNRRGTGAPVRAITDGHVSRVYTDACGGKYVVLKHNDGGSSLYLHLQ